MVRKTGGRCGCEKDGHAERVRARMCECPAAKAGGLRWSKGRDAPAGPGQQCGKHGSDTKSTHIRVCAEEPLRRPRAWLQAHNRTRSPVTGHAPMPPFPQTRTCRWAPS